MHQIKFIIFVFGLLVLTGCKDPYKMDLRPTDQSLLVVEGILNNGKTSSFRLSRTVNLEDYNSLKPELNAELIVEGKDNSIGGFTETGNGTYIADLSYLEKGKEYRLRIRTSNGKEYLSDYVAVKHNPVIDSVSWRQDQDDAVGIYVSTHDAGNNTHYYRWEYEETWEIRSVFYSMWKRVGATKIEPRNLPQEDVSVCWKRSASTNIILGSSAQLTSDVIKEKTLLNIPRTSDRLEHRYSILVRQYALSKVAFEYLQLLKTNTESLGSIFGPLPSEIRGNIHCVSDPKEQVIGFVTASAIHEQRIFISASALRGRSGYRICEMIEIPNNPDSIQAYYSFQPYSANFGTGPNGIESYSASNSYCVDCTSRGGTTNKPSFW